MKGRSDGNGQSNSETLLGTALNKRQCGSDKCCLDTNTTGCISLPKITEENEKSIVAILCRISDWDINDAKNKVETAKATSDKKIRISIDHYYPVDFKVSNTGRHTIKNTV